MYLEAVYAIADALVGVGVVQMLEERVASTGVEPFDAALCAVLCLKDQCAQVFARCGEAIGREPGVHTRHLGAVVLHQVHACAGFVCIWHMHAHAFNACICLCIGIS
jgi:hypothetical protein